MRGVELVAALAVAVGPTLIPVAEGRAVAVAVLAGCLSGGESFNRRASGDDSTMSLCDGR